MVEAKKATQTKKEAEEVKVKAPKSTKEVKEAPVDIVVEETTAKAGKRSSKGIEQAKEKQAKVERQHHAEEEKAEAKDKPKVTKTPTRSRLERRGKKYQEMAKLIEKGKAYTVKEAVELATKTNPTKFAATVELHVRLAVDPKHADQNVRDTVVLPSGSGKKLNVAVFADAEDVKKAKAAGADIAGSDEFLQTLDKGELNFDVLIATPLMMAKLGKYARILGPKGLMPNPKSGTVAADVAKAVKEAKAGKVEYRVDSNGIVHLGIGKTSFSPPQLLENLQTVLASIKSAKPASVKGTYIQSIYLTTSMGPSITISASEV